MNHSPRHLQQWFEASRMPEFAPRFNIAPGNAVLAVRAAPLGRETVVMRWGFVPSWADDTASAPILHNARCETVAEKPMFREAFRSRRCLIPASGFYEWKSVARQKFKQPFYLSLRDGSPLSFAGLWDCTLTETGQAVEACVIVTTKANAIIEPIHHRMPVLLDREAWALWLDAEASVADLLALLRPHPPERMQVWEVAANVNCMLDDSPALLAPLAGKTDAEPVLL